MYNVEPSGEVCISSKFRRRVIRKADPIEQGDPSDAMDSANARSSNLPRWPFVVAIVSLVLGIPPIWPYGYYVLLRLIVCGVAVYGAMQANSQQRMGWVWALGTTAVLFNPLIPVHLTKDAWVLIDLIAAILLGIAMSVLHQNPTRGSRSLFWSGFKEWSIYLLGIVIMLLVLVGAIGIVMGFLSPYMPEELLAVPILVIFFVGFLFVSRLTEMLLDRITVY
jgi:hypothetical protein